MTDETNERRLTVERRVAELERIAVILAFEVAKRVVHDTPREGQRVSFALSSHVVERMVERPDEWLVTLRADGDGILRFDLREKPGPFGMPMSAIRRLTAPPPGQPAPNEPHPGAPTPSEGR
jgi:hypothetical protein